MSAPNQISRQEPWWLLRSDEINMHLRSAAASAEQVCLVADKLRIVGCFGTISEECVTFRPAESCDDPPVGLRVRVEYRRRHEMCNFYSRLASVRKSGTWVLDLPRTVERADMRASPRVDAGRFGGALVRLMDVPDRPAAIVLDLSAEGLAVLFAPTIPPPEVEEIVSCELLIGDAPPIALAFEVRNTRPPDRGAKGLLVGARLVHIGPHDRQRYEQVLAKFATA